MAIISDAFRALFGTKQKEKESLQDYTRRFITQKVLESHIEAPIALVKYVQGMQGYKVNDEQKVEELTKIGNEQLMAYIYLENADEDKYGSMLTNLSSQKSLNNDQYLWMITLMNNVLSNHRFDKKPKANKDNKARQNKPNNDAEEEKIFTLTFCSDGREMLVFQKNWA